MRSLPDYLNTVALLEAIATKIGGPGASIPLNFKMVFSLPLKCYNHHEWCRKATNLNNLILFNILTQS